MEGPPVEPSQVPDIDHPRPVAPAPEQEEVSNVQMEDNNYPTSFTETLPTPAEPSAPADSQILEHSNAAPEPIDQAEGAAIQEIPNSGSDLLISQPTIEDAPPQLSKIQDLQELAREPTTEGETVSVPVLPTTEEVPPSQVVPEVEATAVPTPEVSEGNLGDFAAQESIPQVNIQEPESLPVSVPSEPPPPAEPAIEIQHSEPTTETSEIPPELSVPETSE
jgi:hypothetical protein